MGNDINDAHKAWADAANRRIANAQNGDNYSMNALDGWATERMNNMNVKMQEGSFLSNPNKENGSEINTTQQRANDLATALKAAQDPNAKQEVFDSGANLYSPQGNK